VYATFNEVLYQSLEALYVERLVIFQWCYQRWNNPAEWFLESCFHCFNLIGVKDKKNFLFFLQKSKKDVPLQKNSKK
jgi:hypothetical protein